MIVMIFDVVTNLRLVPKFDENYIDTFSPCLGG